jgi:hypothetical protein
MIYIIHKLPILRTAERAIGIIRYCLFLADMTKARRDAIPTEELCKITDQVKNAFCPQWKNRSLKKIGESGERFPPLSIFGADGQN